MKTRTMLGLTVLWGAVALAVDMPAGYTHLGWIESDAAGLQWIDSGYYPTSSTVIRASILARVRRIDWASFFGVMQDDSPGHSVVARYFNNSNFNFIFCNSTYGEASIPSKANGEYDFELKYGSAVVTGTETTTRTITSVDVPANAPIYIFCENNYNSTSGASAPYRYQPMRLYSFKIYEGEGGVDVLKRDFIPCIDTNGAYGLWDAVEGTFHGNQASGADFAGGVIYAAEANEKKTVPSASGMMELRGGDAATSEIEVGSVAAGSLVYVANSLKAVTLDSVGSGVNIVIRKLLTSDAPLTLVLPAGQLVDSLTIEEGLTVYLGSGSVGSIEGIGKIVVGGAVKYGTISNGIDVKVEAGGSMVSGLSDVLAATLGDLPALWLDASDETTFQEYTYNGHAAPEGTFPGIVVRRWDDCRGGADRYFAVNARSSTTGNSDGGFIRTMPYSVTNELNGLTVLSFGGYDTPVNGAANAIREDGTGINETGRKEQRRMVFNQPIESKTIIMVYGSQDGGGMALVGGWKSGQKGEKQNPLPGETIADSGQATYYNRNAATVEAMTIATGRANVPCWVDGKAIVPNETAALNGGYQIVSLGVAPGDSPSVRSLGMSDEYGNAGGQRYGEILVFTNELTTVQRRAVEVYLAQKWGLKANYSFGEACPKSLEIAEGGVFETVGSAVAPHGGGTLSIAGALLAEGLYSGSVTVAAGASLTLRSKDPWTEEQVDAVASLVARFDPDCEADVGFNSTSNMVHAVFGHGKKDVAGTPYVQAYYVSANNDRRPTYSRGARGYGPVRGWMDLHADPAGVTQKGNNLRVKTDHGQWKGSDSSLVKLDVKTAFIVMDSCYGGGLPIIDAVNPGTVVKARQYADYTAPIWGSGTSAILTGGETRINGQAVDGTTKGFTGAPELFSFTTDGNAFQAGVFGYYNAGGGEQAYEVLGEIILFNEILTDDTRSGIEAYLMKKWLGRLPPGYVDWTGATVGGAGTVSVERQGDLPTFADFTGTLDLGAEALSFTLDGATKTVEGAVDVGGATLKLAAQGTIALSFKDGISKPGSYTLASFGTLAEPGISGWTLPARTGDGKFKINFTADNGQLVARVLPAGLRIIIR